LFKESELLFNFTQVLLGDVLFTALAAGYAIIAPSFTDSFG